MSTRISTKSVSLFQNAATFVATKTAYHKEEVKLKIRHDSGLEVNSLFNSFFASGDMSSADNL